MRYIVIIIKILYYYYNYYAVSQHQLYIRRTAIAWSVGLSGCL